MNFSIVRVHVPGLGAACVECLSRGHAATSPLPPKEIYTFGVTNPQAEYSWDIDAARALVAARPRSALRLNRAWLAPWLLERSQFTPEHLNHIPADKLEEPGVFVEVLANRPGGPPEPFRILIDGTHRAARRLRDGQDCWAYLLTEAEQRPICTYRREGCAVECPSFPGAGITEFQAGVFGGPSAERDVA